MSKSSLWCLLSVHLGCADKVRSLSGQIGQFRGRVGFLAQVLLAILGFSLISWLVLTEYLKFHCIVLYRKLLLVYSNESTKYSAQTYKYHMCNICSGQVSKNLFVLFYLAALVVCPESHGEN